MSSSAPLYVHKALMVGLAFSPWEEHLEMDSFSVVTNNSLKN